MIKPYLCVCDLDETLLNSEKRISAANQKAVLELSRAGIPFTIATGRSHLQIREFVRTLAVTVPVITCNGGVMSTPEREEILSVSYLEPKRARAITAFCEENRLDYLMYTARHICYTPESRRIQGYMRYNEAIHADDTRDDFFCVPMRDMRAVTERDFSEAIKILVLGDEAMLFALAERFNRDQTLTVVSSGAGLIDIMAQATTKGGAVRALAERLAIPMERVAVFGDSPNDTSMFEVAGIRVAMENAVDEVRTLADFVTKTNNESGIAHALSQLFEIPDYSA